MELQEEIKEVHEDTKRSDQKDLITSWTEKELYKQNVEAVFSVILRTRGCSWSYTSGCSMCGYYTDTNPDVTEKDLEKQVEEALNKYEGQKVVKIYTSGSFLDESEVPKSIADYLLGSLDSQGAEKILVESRPEFVRKDTLEHYSEQVDELEIALGLESANDFVLKNCINKGFTYDDYVSAKEKILDMGLKMRTYLLLKPPFLREKEAVEDVLNSIKKVQHPDNIISINPVNIQRGSLVERLWRNGTYRPPWLWSIVDLLKRTMNMENESMIVCSKAGLGSERGAHNCEKCDEEIIESIEKFNLTQETRSFKNLTEDTCSCHEDYKIRKDIESFLYYRGDPKILSDRYAGYL